MKKTSRGLLVGWNEENLDIGREGLGLGGGGRGRGRRGLKDEVGEVGVEGGGS